MKTVTCTNAKLEVVDYGPGTRKTPRPGTPVVAMPLLHRMGRRR